MSLGAIQRGTQSYDIAQVAGLNYFCIIFLTMASTSKSSKFQTPETVDPPLVPLYFQLSYFMTQVCTHPQRKPPKTGVGDASLLAWCEVRRPPSWCLFHLGLSWMPAPSWGVDLGGSSPLPALSRPLTGDQVLPRGTQVFLVRLRI